LEIHVSDHSDRSRGRVVHDPKGNAVWDWAIATGVLNNASIDDLIDTLTGAVYLSFEEGNPPAPGEWAGDPYNRPNR
jgi:hypothetical protein